MAKIGRAIAAQPSCAIIFLSMFLLINPIVSFSQVQINKTTRILLMLDCSKSMQEDIGGSKVEKMAVAKKLIIRMVDSLSKVPDLELALHTYGDQHRENDCKDSRLAVYFEPGNTDRIKKAIKSLEPKGTTPIAYSLSMAQNEFPAGRGNNYVILITDGIEECGGDPCSVSRNLQDKGIILKPFIIGIGLSESSIQTLHCVGRVYNTKTENDLSEILNLVVAQALNNTTVQVNLNNSKGQPKEKDVNMTFSNSKTHEVVANYYQTFNKAGIPDTFKLDPLYKYDLQVNTTPQIIKRGIELKSGQNNIISVDASQGNLQINTKDNSVKSLVREDHTTDIIYIQEANTTHRYLTGVYDIEALTLPRTHYYGVKVDENQLKKIDIPGSGHLDITYVRDVVGSIFSWSSGKPEWVVDLSGNTRGPKEGYDLQPGTYRIIYRMKVATQTEQSITREFTITSGQKASIELNK